MNKQTSCKMQWFVAALIFLLLAYTALCQMEPAVNNVVESLIHAVKENDNEAYRAARSAALELEDGEFDTLLEVLAKADTWQALAVKNGLRVRRVNPELAAAFDEIVDWVKNNPSLTRIGDHRFQVEKISEEFDTAEGDWLRSEAVLTEKAVLPPDRSGMQLPGWIAFRQGVFDGGARYADDMKVRIMMLRDMPNWIPDIHILGLLPASIRRSSDKVDAYVPELVGHYMRIRREMVKDPKVPVHIQPRPTISTFNRIIEAIAEADADVALPALKQIHEFEQTTGAEIDVRLAADQARKQEVVKLQIQAAREGREEDANKLELERRELVAQGVRTWGAPLSSRILEKLDELIEKHQKAEKQ